MPNINGRKTKLPRKRIPKLQRIQKRRFQKDTPVENNNETVFELAQINRGKLKMY